MFKLIPGNDEYVISLTQDVRKKDGSVVNLEQEENKVFITLYGRSVKVCPKWLSLISHFELNLPGGSFDSLLNVVFVDTNIVLLKSVSGKIPLFKKPVTIKHHGKMFRIIPSYSRYAVSADGEVLEVSSGELLKVSLERGKRGGITCKYPSVFIYSPEKMSYRYQYVHRLVAFAWVKNPGDNYILNPLVNHKDGDKLNYHCSNLEWCSFSLNNIHAVDTGLRSDSVKCKVRDFFTGEVREFMSLARAREYMGVVHENLRSDAVPVRKGYLIKGKYELKLHDDDTPWFYENRTEKVKQGRYMVEVVYQDGSIEYFHDTRDLKAKFKLWNCPNIHVMLEKARAENIGVKFNLTDFYKKDIVQSYNSTTNEILEASTVGEISRLTGVPRHRIKYCLRGNETWLINGYAFRYKTLKDWNTDFINRDNGSGIRVLATNTVTNETKEFNSIRSMSKFFPRVDRSWLNRCVKQGLIFDDWSFTVVNT